MYVGTAGQMEALTRLARALDSIPEDNEFYLAQPIPVRHVESSPTDEPAGQFSNDGAGWFFEVTS